MKVHHNYRRGADTRHTQAPKEVAVQFVIDCMDKGRQMVSKQADNNHTKQLPVLVTAHTFTMRNGETQDIIRVENGKDKEGKFCAYSLVAHNCNYKASELGKARNLTVSRIAETWRKLHEEQKANHDKHF